MHDFTRACFQQARAASVFLLAMAAPLAAQDHRTALGISGGWSAMDDLAPGLATPAFFEAGWIAGVQLEAWTGSGRVGLRLDGSYAPRALDGAPEIYRLANASLDLLIRPLRAEPGRVIAPFIALGAGALHVDATDGAAILAGGAYGDDPATFAAATAGLGFDIARSRRFGLRLEAVDRIIFPSIGESPPTSGLPLVHTIHVQTALQIRGGRISEAPTVIAAARPAPAAPVASPEPMAPAEEPVVAEPKVEEPVVAAPKAEAAAMSAEETAWVRAELERLDALRSQELTRLESRIDELESRLSRSERAVAARPAPVDEDLGPGPYYTVQVGAFVEVATALRWEERLRAVGLPAWLTDAVVKGQAVKRVRVGMLPSLDEAKSLARVLQLEYGWPTWVDRVSKDTPVEGHTISSTRTFLRGY